MTFLCRYPGGKAKLARPIMERLNECNVNDYREPFVGGGAIALRMMTSSSASCWINDIDHTVNALWLAIASHADDLKQAVREFQPSVEEFRRIKAGFLSNGPILATDVVRIALDKLAIQAMSFSGLGVMSNAPVGGWSQRNSNVGSRWLPETLCKRIDLISPHLARARVTNTDFSGMLCDDGRAAVYLDPPYYGAGPELYQHSFAPADHLRLRNLLRHTSHDWVLSYDDCPQIRDLYSFAHIEELEVTYSVSKARRTRELLIYPRHRNRSFLAMAA